MSKNFYDILEINRSATQEEIKKAYKKLALIHHPDKGGDATVFQDIQAAYETLKDAEKKNLYDQMGHDMYINKNQQPNVNMHNHNINIHNIFTQMFNMSMNQNRNQSPDKFIQIDLSLEEVFKGVTQKMNVGIIKKCDSCKINCDKCNGNGRNVFIQQNGIFTIRQEVICDLCEGRGFFSTKSCTRCKGDFEYIVYHIIEFTVPSHAESGYKFKICEDVPKDYTLYIVVNILPHESFKRAGDDLIFTTNIKLCESIVGVDLTILVFGEEININTASQWGIIKPNTQYFINGKGMCNTSGNRGNLICIFEVEYPRLHKLTTEDKNKFRDLFSSMIDNTVN
uniref:J domain-containing protein n=1 Tax=viral metagenome TaxID=1070528 RepID=A0A6C0CZX1_9ZZZZ